MASVDSFARIGTAGVALFVASVVLMHAVQPELSPIEMAVSYYMNGRLGWLLGLGLISLGIGSLSLGAGLRRLLGQTGTGVGFRLLVLWSVGCILGGLFPPDPPGHWDEPPSISGMIHGGVALVAFIAFPVAAWLLSRRVAPLPELPVAARLLVPLAIFCTVSLAVFFVCLAPVFANRPPYALGLVERVLLVFYAGWLVALGVNMTRFVRSPL